MSDAPKMQDRPDDHELEEFLAGRGPVSESYRQSRAEEAAPPELDAPVLALARQALEQPAPRRLGWQSLRLPVALAATVVLSFSTFMMLREERGATSVAGFPPAAAPEFAPAAEVMMDAAPPAQKQKAESEPASPPAMAQKRIERREKKEQVKAPPAVAAESEPILRSEQYTEEDSAGSSRQSLSRKAMPPAPAAAGAAANSAPAFAQSAESSDQGAIEPEEWIRQIRQLRDSSETERARTQLEALLKVYPQYLVPEDLKSLLPPPSP